MTSSSNGASRPPAGPYDGASPPDLAHVVNVLRAACVNEDARELLGAVALAVSGLANGAAAALLLRDGAGLSLGASAGLSQAARNALGTLADADRPLTRRVLGLRSDAPIRLGFRGSTWDVYPMWIERAAKLVGALLVEIGASSRHSVLARLLPQLACDIAPVVSTALRARDLDELVDRLTARLEERDRDIDAGQSIIDDLERRLPGAVADEATFDRAPLDHDTADAPDRSEGPRRPSWHRMMEPAPDGEDPITGVVRLHGGLGRSSGGSSG